MDIKAPYLEAIQIIAGTTPGEKQKTINIIARQIARAESSRGDPFRANIPIPDVPEPLQPLVRVEVAKILHQCEGIIEALKSEDFTVVSRALQAKWFFNGTDANFVNAQDFLENELPEISLSTRSRIAKHFALYLKNTRIASEFFVTWTQQYGVGQATPLLLACDEHFVYEMIILNKIILPLRMVQLLYRKYPNLVVKYLMLNETDDDDTRNLHHIDIRDYEDFLPELANTRFEDFIEIYGLYESMLNIKLGKTGTKTLINTHSNLLIEKPKQYLKLISLRTATQKLCAADFVTMFKNLFPADRHDFRFSTMNGYLQYYKPEQEKLCLILNTFRELYDIDLLSCRDLMQADLIRILPTKDRIHQARLQLENDKDWHFYDYENSWRCYLVTTESIPLITKEIVKTTDAGKRGQLLKELIYTCKVNGNPDALLKVMSYIYDKHRNEQKCIFYSCLSLICDAFDLATLSSDYWEVLNKFIKFAEMQDDLCTQTEAISRLIEMALHYCILNHLPWNDYVRIFIDMKIQLYNAEWNILKKYPDLEKKLLDVFIETIPKQYPLTNKIWKSKEANIICDLASSLWDFNDRNKLLNGKFKKLFVKDYPWLLERVKVNILGEIDKYKNYSQLRFLGQIRKNERDLYYTLIRDLEKFWVFDTNVIADVLIDNPQRVLDNWENCLEQIKRTIRRDQYSLSLISKTRWYQHLPIKFFDDSLKNYKNPETCGGTVATLALLSDGATYTKIIEQYVPDDESMDIYRPDAKSTYTVLLAITKNLRIVNPPVSLEVIARFCIGDYLQLALQSLTSVCRRLPVAHVITFAKTLANRRVSVMKHGIRLIYLVAPLEQIYICLTDLWNSEGHTSIRSVVFNKIHDFFCKQPDIRGWTMLQTCMDSLNINDDEEIFKLLTQLSSVPNEYLHEYIESAHNALESMKQQSEQPNPYTGLLCQLIRNIDGCITEVLSEAYTQHLIKQYLFVFDYDGYIFSAGLHLTLDSYLLSTKNYNAFRFEFFGDFFRNSVKKYWNKQHPKCFKFYPMNVMVNKFFTRLHSMTCVRYDFRMFESFLAIFQSALQPYQDAVSYVDLIYSVAFHKSLTSVDFGLRIAQEIPRLTETFSDECVISMSNRLVIFLRERTFSDMETNEEKMITIIEMLVNNSTVHSAFFAANMLFDNSSSHVNQRLQKLIRILRENHNPGILWFLNEYLASFNYYPGKEY